MENQEKGSSGFAGGVEILGVDGLEEGTETGDLGLFVLVLQLDSGLVEHRREYEDRRRGACGEGDGVTRDATTP